LKKATTIDEDEGDCQKVSDNDSSMFSNKIY
jgi:hypothetical protein